LITELIPAKAMVGVKQRLNDARVIKFAELLLIVGQSLNVVPVELPNAVVP